MTAPRSPRHLLFGTVGRRAASVVVAACVYVSSTVAIHRYIDHHATSPGLAFVLLFVWMALGVLTALVVVIGLGDLLFHRGFSRDFLRDEMAEIDARIDREARGEVTNLPAEDDDDLALMPRGNASMRFGIYFVLLTAALLMAGNSASGGFLQRFSHPGMAVIHMRSDSPKMRREGLTMLTTSLKFRVTAPVAAVVVSALGDPDEGVAARAAFVAGTLGVEDAADRLAEMARARPPLTFTALIALGFIGGERAREQARAIADDPVALREPLALAYMLGMLRVPAVERLLALHAAAPDDEHRVAALWALGRLRDPRLFDAIVPSLRSESLVVRCVAVGALEEMVVFEAARPLMRAFEASSDPLTTCPEVAVPAQEGGRKMLVVPHRNYELGLVRAMATTDDPELMPWLVKHQEGRESRTHQLMHLLYDRLKEKEASGLLNHLKERVRLRRLQERGQELAAPGDAPPGDAPPGDASLPRPLQVAP